MQPPSPEPSLPRETPEIVHRPEPRTLGRGAWEAPSWAFYASAAIVVLGAALYAVVRLGWHRRRPAVRKR